MMNKVHIYRGISFNIVVEINNVTQRRVGGITYHKIIVNAISEDYYESLLCETHNLVQRIDIMIKNAERFFDFKLDGDYSNEAKLLLESIGFTKINK